MKETKYNFSEWGQYLLTLSQSRKLQISKFQKARQIREWWQGHAEKHFANQDNM